MVPGGHRDRIVAYSEIGRCFDGGPIGGSKLTRDRPFRKARLFAIL
jgi:hypothetical protein